MMVMVPLEKLQKGNFEVKKGFFFLTVFYGFEGE